MIAMRRRVSDLEDTLHTQLTFGGLNAGLETEYRFAAIASGGTGDGVRTRLRDAGLQDWKFDFAWPDRMIAAEVDGGTWSGGRHVRGAGYEGDCIKLNYAASMGWKVFRYTGAMVTDGRAFAQLNDVLLPF